MLEKLLKQQTLYTCGFWWLVISPSIVIQQGPCWMVRALQLSDQRSSNKSYSCWWEAFFLSCFGSFLYSAVCREVSLSRLLLLCCSFSTDSPHFRLNPNIKYPDSHVNIQYIFRKKGPGHLVLVVPKPVAVSEESAVYFQILFNLSEP